MSDFRRTQLTEEEQQNVDKLWRMLNDAVRALPEELGEEHEALVGIVESLVRAGMHAGRAAIPTLMSVHKIVVALKKKRAPETFDRTMRRSKHESGS